MVKVPARSILPMIAFRDALCITHNPVNGTVSQGREGPARFAGCRITLRTPVGIIRKAALWNLCRARHNSQGKSLSRPCRARRIRVVWLFPGPVPRALPGLKSYGPFGAKTQSGNCNRRASWRRMSWLATANVGETGTAGTTSTPACDRAGAQGFRSGRRCPASAFTTRAR